MPRLKVNGVSIDDTFAEAFGMRATAIVITGAEPQMGAAGGDLDDRLRDIGHRLRLRGGDRCRTAAVGDARRPAWLSRDDLCGQHGRTAEATAEPRRPMRADVARQRLLCRPGRTDTS